VVKFSGAVVRNRMPFVALSGAAFLHQGEDSGPDSEGTIILRSGRASAIFP